MTDVVEVERWIDLSYVTHSKKKKTSAKDVLVFYCPGASKELLTIWNVLKDCGAQSISGSVEDHGDEDR